MKKKKVICRLRVSLYSKKLYRGLENAARGRRPRAAFSRPRKVTCHQSRHIVRNITCQILRQTTRHTARQITLYITRQITLQRTRQITRNITRQMTRQIIIIIISPGFVGTVAISYQVAIIFSRKANLRLSLQHLYTYFKVKSPLVLYFKGALQRCFAPL